MRICEVVNCNNKHLAKGLCSTHYRRSILGKSLDSPIQRQNATLQSKFYKYVSMPNEHGCLIWTGGKPSNGYGSIRVGGKMVSAHVAAWFLKHGKWPTMYLLHSCHNKSCVNTDHLREGTQLDNMRDKVEARRQAKGESNGQSKLKENNVVDIRALYKIGVSSTELSTAYQVSQTTIHNIVINKTWRHI